MQKTLQINDTRQKKEIILNSEEDIRKSAKYITEIIRDRYEKQIIESIIKNNYTYLEKSEQMFVLNDCKKFLNNISENLNDKLFNILYNYIKEESTLDLKGFIRFRLKDYIKKIENSVDSAVNAFIIEREYEQLIEGLIMYAELQTPLTDTINILQINDKYIVTDKNGNEIFTLINYDDLLLDVILTLAPRQIIIINIENFKNKELMETINKVFSKRLIFINSSENNITNKINSTKGDKW